MPRNEVYANGQEIACKAADGRSVACFPDPCWSPPGPPAGPVVIPYANTAYARDLANGSRTVFISGQPVAKKNQSYLATSTGNEAATRAFGMGVITHTIQGKAYFASWSMNVKVEGLNVCRHQDLMTHNHASVVGNTGTWHYLDQATSDGACKGDLRKVERKCKPTKQEGTGKQARDVPDPAKGAWKRQYCDGLRVKPPTADDYDPKQIEARLNELLEVGKRAEAALAQARDILIEQAKVWAARKAAELLAKSAIKGWLGPIGWVWTAYDVISGGIELKDLYDVIDEMKEDLAALKSLPAEIEAIRKQGLTPAAMADAQTVLAKLDPCLRARKCLLVKFSENRAGKNSNKGCCAGQTAHHVLPKAQFEGLAACPGYREQDAPTICVEGTSHKRGGSHQKLHEGVEKLTERRADRNGELSYETARDTGIEAVRALYPQCSAKCLKAQLDAYHQQACGGNAGFKVLARSSVSGRTYSGGM